MKVPKYRKHSSSDQARVTLGGRTYYLGKFGTKESKALYNRLVGEYVASGGVILSRVPADSLTVSEILLAYLRFAEKHYGSESTELDDLKRVMKRLRKLYGPTVAAEFGYLQFEAIRQGLVNDGLSRCYINEQMRRLIRIFRWTASRQLIPTSVPEALRMIEPLTRGRTKAPERKKILPVSKAIVEAVIPHLPTVLQDMVRLQALLGCRPGEVCAITPGMIVRNSEVWEIHLTDHKNAHRGKSRTIFVGPKAQEILKRYLDRPEDSQCFRPIDSERLRRKAASEQRVVPLNCGNRPSSRKQYRAGEKYDSSTYAKAIQRACKRAFPAPKELDEVAAREWELKHRWSPNRLRHSFGTEIRRSHGLDASRVLMGHSNAQTTCIYAEEDRDKAIEIVRMIG